VGRFAKNTVRTYIIISSLFLIVSFLPDIAVASAPFPGAGWPYSITLMLMHVVAGFITVYTLDLIGNKVLIIISRVSFCDQHEDYANHKQLPSPDLKSHLWYFSTHPSHFGNV